MIGSWLLVKLVSKIEIRGVVSCVKEDSDSFVRVETIQLCPNLVWCKFHVKKSRGCIFDWFLFFCVRSLNLGFLEGYLLE